MRKFGSWSEQETGKFRTTGDNKELTLTPPSSLTGASLTLTLPDVSGTADTLVSNTSTSTMTNKTLTLPIIAQISNTGTLTLPTSTDTLIGRATTDTLTNKSIDADTNTITNIENADIKAGAAIDATKIGSGTVDNTEFALLNGITSAVVSVNDIQTLTNKTIDADNNTISNLEHGAEVDNPTSGVHGVTGNVVGTTDTQTLSNKTLTLPQINDTSSDHQYVFAVSELTLDRTVTLPLLTGNDTFVFEAHSQSLTNKTIDADNNTISNLAHGAEVDNPTSGVHGVTGNVVGTSDAQTLTNKTFDADLNTVSNIDNADIKAAAAIDAAKIHDASVSNTEFGYLNGVTSAIQTQIDGKTNDVITTQGDIILGNISGEEARLGIGAVGTVLTSNGTTASWDTPAGTGDVSAALSLTDNAIIRGDGGVKGVQDSGILIDDSDNITGATSLTASGNITSTAGEVRVTRGDATQTTMTLQNVGGNNVLVFNNGTQRWDTRSNSGNYQVYNNTGATTVIDIDESTNDITLSNALSTTDTIQGGTITDGTASFTSGAGTGITTLTTSSWIQAGGQLMAGNNAELGSSWSDDIIRPDAYGVLGSQGSFGTSLTWNWYRTGAGFAGLSAGASTNAGTIHINAGGIIFQYEAGWDSSPTADPIDIARFDTAGNLGIGTTSPATVLDVRDTTTDLDNGVLRLNNEGSANGIVGLSFYNTNGTPAAGSRNWKISTGRTGAGTLDFQYSSTNTGTADANTALSINNAGNATFNNQVTVTDDLIVDTNTLFVDASTNRVGILTTSPNSALMVDGTIEIGDSATAEANIGFSKVATRHLRVQSEPSHGTSNFGITFSIGNATDSDSVINAYGMVRGNSNDATSPTYSFITDVNTGIYSGGADIIGFSTAGTARMTLDADGDLAVDTDTLFVDASADRVGINTASPSASLDVVGDAVVSGDLTVNTSDFFVDASANFVGIGTASPNSRLTVVPGAVSSTSIGGRSIPLGVRVQTSSGRNGYMVEVANNFTADDDSAGYYWVYPFSTGGNAANKVYRAAVGATLSDIFYVAQNGDGYFAGDLTVDTDLTITNGNGEFTNGVLKVGATGGAAFTIDNNNAALAMGLKVTETTGTIEAIRFLDGANTDCGSIDINTDANTTAYNTSSDERLKTNFDATYDALSMIDQIEAVSYERLCNLGTTEYGVKAQQVNDIIPQAVTPGDDVDVNERPWKVDYSQMVGPLLRAVQQLSAKCADYEARLAALENPGE